jgi:hypothetical protein
MALDVPICRVESLPNAVQVGFAVRCTRRHIGLGLASGLYHNQPERGYHGGCSTRKYRASQRIPHLCLSSEPATRHFGPTVHRPTRWPLNMTIFNVYSKNFDVKERYQPEFPISTLSFCKTIFQPTSRVNLPSPWPQLRGNRASFSCSAEWLCLCLASKQPPRGHSSV